MISRRPSTGSESVSGVERAGHGTIQGVEQGSQTKSAAGTNEALLLEKRH